MTAIAEFYERGATRWPLVRCTLEQFAKIAAELEPDALSSANAHELYLTAALWSGDPDAMAAFESAYVHPQRGRLARMGLSDSSIDDALQTVRERLLLPTNGAPPRITTLVGRGDFGALFRVVAVRTGLNLLRTEKRRQHNEDQAMLDNVCVANSALDSLMQREAAQLLRDAVERVVRRLGRRERTLLRLHFSHGLTIDAIGRMYNVHRATAARWLCRVHDSIEKAVKLEVREFAGQTTTNLDELVHLASSQLQLSFARILAATTDARGTAALRDP
ncbi:MAG: hypothetical protein MJE77_36450 [Proteobacteria bacterium]|nr:hypothetical protein [Pseudomonadota bacterium]